MRCEIRKSCNLRNVVYEIGKLGAPVGIILVDMTDTDHVLAPESPREKFWVELRTVFREVGQAYEETLEKDIQKSLSGAAAGAAVKTPIVVEAGAKNVFTKSGHDILAVRMRDAGIKRIVMVCIASGTIGVTYVRQLLTDMTPRIDPMAEVGVDMIVVVDGNADENETSILG